jgi:hypothetical protein
MKKTVLVSVVFLVLALAAAAAHSQSDSYVRSMKAKVMAAPNFKAVVIGEASRGSRLTTLAREGSWIKVRYYGKEAYVPSILVSSSPPIAKVGLIKAEDAEFQQGVRRRASTYTSAAAARGLAADDRRRLSGDDKLDYDALEKVEKYAVSEAELLRFMEGGKI